MRREVGLDQHLARLLRPSGAPGHLNKLREEALGGAEVGAEESAVAVEHAHQREIWIVVSFGEHLRADEDVDLAAAYLVEHAAQRALARGRIAIDARDAGFGKSRAERLLDALR